MSETREALAPCPFCGSNEIVLHHIGNMHTKSRGTEIKCTTAGCSTTKRSMAIKQGFEQTDAWAIAAWNRRALSARDERAEERERCAKIAAEHPGVNFIGQNGMNCWRLATQYEIAATIRAGGTDGH